MNNEPNDKSLGVAHNQVTIMDENRHCGALKDGWWWWMMVVR